MKSEFEFIKNIRARSSTTRIGDDCAVLPKDSQNDLVITTDLLVEDIDFRLKWAIPEFLGHKSLAVSLSDIAAMGAKPVWAMLSIGIPLEVWKTDFVERFYAGWFALAETFNVELIGGDVSKTPDKIVIDSIAAGEVERGEAVLRTKAQIGDLIFVTGELGGAALGLNLLERGARFDFNDESKQAALLLRQLRPNPKVYDGEFLNKNKLATAMIDLSDGLSGDLSHLCRESKVGAIIYAEKIPLHVDLQKTLMPDAEKLDLVLNGGEDFELLFTVKPGNFDAAANEFAERGYIQIGEIRDKSEAIKLLGNDKTEILQADAFQHFK